MPIASIRVVNPLPVARTSTFLCVVPFAQGAVATTGVLTVVGAEAVDIEHWGVRWPDNSVRFARVWARVAMGANETRSFAVEVGQLPATPPETWATTMPLPADSFVTPIWSLAVSSISIARHPWGRLWAKWHLRADVHQPVIHWALELNFSEPSTAALSVTLDQPVGILLPPEAGMLSVHWGSQKNVQVLADPYGQTTIFLPAGLTMAHGQSHVFRGVYCADPALMAAESKPLLAVAENWAQVGCGPTLIKPTMPPWLGTLDNLRAALRRKIGGRIGNPKHDPYYEPEYGLGKTSAETGAQDDFGSIHGLAGFLGAPEWLELAMPDALQEFLTPTHFRESDGSQVTSATHPSLNRWMGRPHRSSTVSRDQLGKPNQDAWTSQQWADFGAASHGWVGRDPQHTSRLLAWSTLMMTGDPQLEDFLFDSAEEFLSSQTLPSTHPGYFSSAMDAARAVGRTLQDASWMYLLSARDDVHQRIVGRVSQVVAPVWSQTAGKAVRPLDIVPRVNLQPYTTVTTQPPEWHPWQEGIAVFGLLCAYFATLHQPAMVLAAGIADTFIRHGWQDRTPSWQVAKAVEWTGDPVPTISDPQRFIPADNTDYRYWVAACEPFLVAFGTDPAMRARASAILASLQRSPSADGLFGTWDRFSQQ